MGSGPERILDATCGGRTIWLDDVLAVLPETPLFGTTTNKRKTTETRWYVFYKEPGVYRR